MKDRAVRLSKALSNEAVKRIPYIIAVGLIIAVFAGVKSYNQTGEAARAARDNSNKVKLQTAAIEKNTKALAEQLKEFKADNAQQTQILCRLILRSDLSLTDEDIAQAQAICKEAIEKISRETARTAATPERNVAQPSKSNPAVPAGGSSSQPTPSAPPAQSNNSQPPPLIVVPGVALPCLSLGQLKVC